ncbi:unnamed protein product, partial [marine sediment metagenome]
AGSPSLTTVISSIIAGNTAGGGNPDLQQFATLIVDYSLIGDNSGTSLTEAQMADADGNLIGSAAGVGIIDPLLDPLADNGGPTETHALQLGSPAIDAGDPSAVAGAGGVPLYDQRGFGFSRVNDDRIDMGAFEAPPDTTPPTLLAPPNQVLLEDTASGPLAILVEDVGTDPNEITVTASSSNTTLIPNTDVNLMLGGSGANRTIDILPAANQHGNSFITITATDPAGNESFVTFSVEVQPDTTPP